MDPRFTTAADYLRAAEIERSTPRDEWVTARAVAGSCGAQVAVLAVQPFAEGWAPCEVKWGSQGLGYSTAQVVAAVAADDEDLDGPPARGGAETWLVQLVPARGSGAFGAPLPGDYFGPQAKRARKLRIVAKDFLKGLHGFASSLVATSGPSGDLFADMRRALDFDEALRPSGGRESTAEELARLSTLRVLALVGPPGTGKTYSLGEIIARRMIQRPTERILALSTAHVAVDKLAIEIYDAFKRLSGSDPAEGQILRARRPGDERLYDEEKRRNMLVWHAAVRRVESDLRAATKERWTARTEIQRLAVEARVKSLEAERDGILSTLVGNAAVVLTSITHAREHEALFGPETFSVVAFDEAGMIGVATLAFWLARPDAQARAYWFAGDPQQLHPIVNYHHWVDPDELPAQLQQSTIAERRAAQELVDAWFSRTVYDLLCYEDPVRRASSLVYLPAQRRMSAPIRDYVSATMYEHFAFPPLRDAAGFTPLGPLLAFSGRQVAIVMVDYETLATEVGKYRYQYDPFDERSAALLASWVGLAVQSFPSAELLVLVRYHEQRRAIMRALRLAFPRGMPKTVRVSTVHRAQGSEADLVIFDPVLSIPNHVGKAGPAEKAEAWRSEERLINVAISRARGQVVVFAHRTEWAPQHRLLGQLSKRAFWHPAGGSVEAAPLRLGVKQG